MRARSYRPTRSLQCVADATAIRRAAEPGAEQLDQLIFGEVFEALEIQGDWAWGRARRDGYVGWVATADLAAEVLRPTHRVSAIRTYAFPTPDLKVPHDLLLTLNALVTVEAEDGRWVKIARGGWVPAHHLAAFDAFERDPVAVAERLLGTPHALGARSSIETDCAGLVQQALLACGLPGPRRSHAQAELGRGVEPGALRRGDLAIWLAPDGDHDWTGHSALMVDAERVIHSTGARGGVVVESLAEVEARFVGDGFASAIFRRL